MPGTGRLSFYLLIAPAFALVSACTDGPRSIAQDDSALTAAIAERDAAAASAVAAIERYCTLREPTDRVAVCMAAKRRELKIDERLARSKGDEARTMGQPWNKTSWLDCDISPRGANCRRSDVALAQLWEMELRTDGGTARRQ